jgi:hypothetical protein
LAAEYGICQVDKRSAQARSSPFIDGNPDGALRQNPGAAAMIEDKDVWMMATLLVAKHGNAAGAHAASRVHELEARGDMTAGIIWKRISRAVAELLRPGPGGRPN